MSELHFGANAKIAIPHDTIIASCGNVSSGGVENIAQAMRDALKSPIAYPDLASMTIPEDRVAIVLEPGLAYTAEVVAGIVHELIAAQIAAERIVIVKSNIDTANSKSSPLRGLAEPLRNAIECVVHDPADREMLWFLGHSANEASPIYVNRHIIDADVVIPVGMGEHHELLGNLGVLGIVVPYFCDQDTVAKFLIPRSSRSKSEHAKRKAETREIAEMVGARLAIQIVLGDSESVANVLVGEAEAVADVTRRECEERWRVSAPRRADLVVAGMSGGKSQQTWQNFARAVRSAMQLVEPDGAIAICSELSSRPGTALRKVVGANSLEAAERKVSKDSSIDALAAAEILSALQNARVYLLSKLDEQFVEDLGLGYISEPEEVARLAGRHKTCITIQNAQRTVVSAPAQ